MPRIISVAHIHTNCLPVITMQPGERLLYKQQNVALQFITLIMKEKPTKKKENSFE